MELSALGWNPHWSGLFEPHQSAGLSPARVVTEDKHFYTVVSEHGPHLGQITGRLLHQKDHPGQLPKVGDWVGIRIPDHTDRVSIECVLPRRTRIARKIAGREAAAQILATNIDLALIVQALGEPINHRRLERFLVMVHEGGAQPVVVLNKADLCPDPEPILAEVRRIAGTHPVLVVSARTGRALPRLRELLAPGSTAVVLGTSGVGKSSLINRLYGERVQPTLPVREWDSKGRHSTTARELILLPNNSLIIDTPGLREFHLWVADDGLDVAFPDIAALAAGCRFRDCAHQSEAGCAVLRAVQEHSLDPTRLQSYLKLRKELDQVATRRQNHTWAANRRRTRSGTRAWLIKDEPDRDDP
jgi:ribosome biogenesis GTPase